MRTNNSDQRFQFNARHTGQKTLLIAHTDRTPSISSLCEHQELPMITCVHIHLPSARHSWQHSSRPAPPCAAGHNACLPLLPPTWQEPCGTSLAHALRTEIQVRIFTRSMHRATRYLAVFACLHHGLGAGLREGGQVARQPRTDRHRGGTLGGQRLEAPASSLSALPQPRTSGFWGVPEKAQNPQTYGERPLLQRAAESGGGPGRGLGGTVWGGLADQMISNLAELGFPRSR